MIKNIIFDLGGVIENLDITLTIRAFKDLGVNDFDSLYTQAKQINLFDKWDRGEIDSAEFRDGIRTITGLPLKDEQIDDAWNAMLLSTPYSRLQLLERVKSRYQTFLLSNTNIIHIDIFNKRMFEDHGVNNFARYFERIYLSYEVGMRKPEKGIFELVLNYNTLLPQETLFIDDTKHHIQSASDLGIKTYFFKPGEEKLEYLFDENGILKIEV